ncbi:zinc-binding dehydrogenase [Olivibacter sp. SDN3]|uniref:zinc-binding dehydrogenase n=1 Tax=Olivibacter sp. SDN3 TaxID=2764720 RepID=UPI0016518818|nr:zinc-binding dehydrogenase [Olivibacter sp. SDN3]QNL50811.1 zinc-binding dehydrogenase [Olivibacter sp. SDN3]
MKAIVLDGINLPLTVKYVDKPQLKANEALVRIKAAALNRRDFWIQKGQYAGLRFPIILGSDGAGDVEEVGSESEGEWIGKEVMINPAINWGDNEAVQGTDFNILGLPQNGTFAEYVKIPVQNLYPVPAHLTVEEAAAFPLAGLTAWRAVFSKANLQKGEKILITGVGGGVATFVLQWAIHADAEVYVTSGKRQKIKKAIDVGAKAGVLYTDKNWPEKIKPDGGFDVIIDSSLGTGFAHHIDLAKPGGRIVFFGGTASGDLPELNARKIFWKQLSILGSTMGSPKDFNQMMTFVNKHQIKPLIDSIHPLAHAEEAIRKMDNADQFGKIVIRID